MPQSESLAVEWRPIGEVRPYEGNPRKMTEAAVRKVAALIEKFGWRQPIVVDEAGVIVVGHRRLKAAQLLGREAVPVHVAVGLTPEEVKAYRLADNRVSEDAEWDAEALGAELLALGDAGFDLELTAFDAAELDRLCKPVAADEIGEAPETRYVEQFGVIVVCGDEEEQRRVYEDLLGKGMSVKVVTT